MKAALFALALCLVFAPVVAGAGPETAVIEFNWDDAPVDGDADYIDKAKALRTKYEGKTVRITGEMFGTYGAQKERFTGITIETKAMRGELERTKSVTICFQDVDNSNDWKLKGSTISIVGTWKTKGVGGSGFRFDGDKATLKILKAGAFLNKPSSKR